MKHRLTKFLQILGFAAISVTTCYASNTGWNFKPGSHDPNSQFHFRLPAQFHDDITSDQDVSKIKLTQAEQHQALAWGLSTEEEQRYVALMKNQSGFFYGDQNMSTDLKMPDGSTINFSHRMTPVEVLGANAQNDAERNKYAQEDAHQQFQYLAKYFAYLAAYNSASQNYKKELNLPILKPFNTAKFSPYNYKPFVFKSNDRLMLFVNIDNAVRPIVSFMMSAMEKDPSIQLNVYFVGRDINKKEVEGWAKSQNIPPRMAKRHQITLNFDDGKFESLSANKKPPVLVLVRGDSSEILNTGGF